LRFRALKLAPPSDAGFFMHAPLANNPRSRIQDAESHRLQSLRQIRKQIIRRFQPHMQSNEPLRTKRIVPKHGAADGEALMPTPAYALAEELQRVQEPVRSLLGLLLQREAEQSGIAVELLARHRVLRMAFETWMNDASNLRVLLQRSRARQPAT